MTTTTARKLIIISLSDRSPVKVDPAEWTVISSDSEHDGEVQCQANHEWWIKVRRHADGRTIVYGALESGNGGTHAGWRGSHAGYLLAADAHEEDVVRAIRRVAGVIEDAKMSANVIAGLPAEAL